VETRGGLKKPILSDLRESGAIEQDADMVLFIYRPEYYKIDEMEDGSSSAGMAELIIAKHRNGALADVKLRFIAQFAQFTDSNAKFNYPGDEAMAPNNAFDDGVITFQSKMNDSDDFTRARGNSNDDFIAPEEDRDGVPF
jgi:replicative DNA helicase